MPENHSAAARLPQSLHSRRQRRIVAADICELTASRWFRRTRSLLPFQGCAEFQSGRARGRFPWQAHQDTAEFPGSRAPCRINVDGAGCVSIAIHTLSSGQGHETLVATVVGEVLQIEPDLIRVVRPDSLACLPSNAPVGSRMAIMLGGAAFHAAEKLKAKLIKIAAQQFGVDAAAVSYSNGGVVDADGKRRLEWAELVNIAHRNHHLLPSGMQALLTLIENVAFRYRAVSERAI